MDGTLIKISGYIRRVFGIAAMVWLAGSVTPSFVSADAPDWAWDFRPQEGRVYFLAFCPRMMDREKELPECLKTASQQASKFERVTVSAGRSSRRVLLFTRHKSRVEAEFDCELAEDMRTRLVVVREHRSDEGTYLLVGLGLETVDPGLLVPTAPSPEWIEKGYSLPGFYTAVGVVQKKRLFCDSAEAADNDALVGLALQLGSEVESGLLDSSRRSPRKFGYEGTEARIHGFLVIARARSSDGRYYYSLAVCPKDGNGE
jgi:hypothetical protein